MNIYFGGNLKNYRLKRNLTQEKLAEFLGVSFLRQSANGNTEILILT